MKIFNELKVLEWNGVQQPFIQGPNLTVSNHLTQRNVVCLTFNDQTIEVYADELAKAIQNIQNAV